MLKLYYAPRTRSVRIRWLLEELGLPHQLERREFHRNPDVFSQPTPLGKFPVLVDGETTMGESGAILEYVLERYGDGRLAPAVGSPLRGQFLQWVHFAESTFFSPIGVLVWHTLYRGDAGEVAPAIESARDRACAALGVVESHLDGRDYLLGEDFSGADIMLGFTLAAAMAVGLLDERYPRVQAYFARLGSRPAFQRATAD